MKMKMSLKKVIGHCSYKQIYEIEGNQCSFASPKLKVKKWLKTSSSKKKKKIIESLKVLTWLDIYWLISNQ